MFLNHIIQNEQVDKLEKLKPLKADKKLMSRLGNLEKQCGQLCDLEKPVIGGRPGEFMGQVKAKVGRVVSSLAPKNIRLLISKPFRSQEIFRGYLTVSYIARYACLYS